MFSKRFDAMQSMVERLPGVAPPIRRSNPDSYTDTPFAEEIASVEMPRKFSFPSIKIPGRPRRKILPKGIQGLRKQEPGQVPIPAIRKRRGAVCVYLDRYLPSLNIHTSAGQYAESDGPTGDASSSPPRQDRVIHVISGGSEVSGVSHAAAKKKSTHNAKHGLETAQPKTLLLGTDEISFTAKEQEKILAPHHDALVFSLTIADCLVKIILVDNRSSSNIIFLTAYQDLGLEENTLTRKVTPLIGFSGEVK
ncbi:hypothetical protein IGI04_019385 [Brassica rapa subsp. trilocularis]|uniref:Uncharacterized protein n=1 Tax=Brassica rapa subsp. trilocularis TaxID=1813537 RepID=A0ABQ7MI35_BRACM|nr:hypothetical protein IGI04_019385 [Brassica rapa subsp. trilocularis]